MRLSLAIEGFLLYRAGAGSMATVRDYRNTLQKWVEHIGDVDTAELSADQVRRFLYHLRIEEELAPKTVKNAWIGLSSFFTWLEGEMGIEHVIRRYKIKMPAAGSREIIPLGKNDVRQLLLACERTAVWNSTKRAPATMQRATRHRDKAIVVVLLDTGLRVSELCDLNIGDVDMKSGAVQVRSGKLDKGRTVYMGNVAKDALWRYLALAQTDIAEAHRKASPADNWRLG